MDREVTPRVIAVVLYKGKLTPRVIAASLVVRWLMNTEATPRVIAVTYV